LKTSLEIRTPTHTHGFSENKSLKEGMQSHLTTATHKSSDIRISGCRAYTPSKMICKSKKDLKRSPLA